MFKFTNTAGNDVWLLPSAIESIEHVKDGQVHYLRLITSKEVYTYDPTSDEDCRKFLHDLFKAMGYDYKYEG